MRNIKLFGLSLFLGLILTVNSIFAQGDVGIIGLMSGRITKPDGRGVGGATISAVAVGSCFDWEGQTARTNPFGYYRLNVHYDCVMLITTTKKSMSFLPSSRIIPIDGTYQNIDFLANF